MTFVCTISTTQVISLLQLLWAVQPLPSVKAYHYFAQLMQYFVAHCFQKLLNFFCLIDIALVLKFCCLTINLCLPISQKQCKLIFIDDLKPAVN